jgi:hypothetical protein
MSPDWYLFTFDSFLKNTEVDQIFWLLFSCMQVRYLFLLENEFGPVWGYYLTNSSGHPDCDWKVKPETTFSFGCKKNYLIFSYKKEERKTMEIENKLLSSILTLFGCKSLVKNFTHCQKSRGSTALSLLYIPRRFVYYFSFFFKFVLCHLYCLWFGHFNSQYWIKVIKKDPRPLIQHWI